MIRSRANRIYPVFLPHAGCPYRCVYCNQHAVTRPQGGGSAEDGPLEAFHRQYSVLFENACRSGIPGEIAFYGGTFTSLPGGVLRHVLDRARDGVESGTFTGIRFSTRPDSLGSEVLALLSEYPIRTVELGVQSLSDRVLKACARGYDSSMAEEAGRMVRRMGWHLGIQMMPGLPGDDWATFLDSISRVIRIGPDFARLYPTLVLENTQLAEQYRRNEYRPLALDEAVEWCVSAYDLLLGERIPVIRMGLHADPELEKPGNILGGPYHPAFGYLVKARHWRRKVDGYLAGEGRNDPGKTLLLRVPERVVSEFRGPSGANVAHWQARWGIHCVRIVGEEHLASGCVEYSWE